MFSLKDKIILVAGSTGYLGKAISEGLAKMGAKIYVNGRTKDSVNKTVDSLIKKGYQAKPALFDITDYKQVEVQIFNLSGRLVHQSVYQSNAPIKLSSFREGLYLLRLIDRKKGLNYTQKIIKIK